MLPNLNFPDRFTFGLVGQIDKEQLIKPSLSQQFRWQLGYIILIGNYFLGARRYWALRG